MSLLTPGVAKPPPASRQGGEPAVQDPAHLQPGLSSGGGGGVPACC